MTLVPIRLKAAELYDAHLPCGPESNAAKFLGAEAGFLACDQAMQNQYPNPRGLERAALRQLLQDAFEGNRPD